MNALDRVHIEHDLVLCAAVSEPSIVGRYHFLLRIHCARGVVWLDWLYLTLLLLFFLFFLSFINLYLFALCARREACDVSVAISFRLNTTIIVWKKERKRNVFFILKKKQQQK